MEKQNNKIEGCSIGRPCCGSRNMIFYNDAKKVAKSTFTNYRNFHGWYCSVNWFFLHLEQQTDSVYHHQTCQAKFDGTRGSIGKISNGDEILKELEKQLKEESMPTIICPKKSECGCGLCVPKSTKKEFYSNVLHTHVDMNVFSNSFNEKSKFEGVNEA